MPWRRASTGRMGQLLRVPTLVGLGTMVVLYATGWVRIPAAVVGFGFCAFTLAVTLGEYWKGMQARHRQKQESYPLALWRLAGRNRRRYGGYFIHLGVIVVAIGIIGSRFYQVETQQNVALGESLSVSSPFIGTYELTYQGLRDVPSIDDRIITQATLSVTKDGQPAGILRPNREFFVVQQQPMTIPDKRSTFSNDLYVIIAGWEAGGETATFKVYINPLVNWIWFGGLIFILGTLVAAWPDAREERQRVAARAFGRAVPAK